MDSPLNLAHQQSRQADSLIRSGKYDEAIVCHRKAAEYILDAMQLTSSEHALQSLQLQHQHHLRQQDLIYERRLRVERAQYAQKSSQNQTNQSCQTEGLDPCVDEIGGNMHPGYFDEAEIYRTLTQTDTLLAFLQKRSISQESPDRPESPKVMFSKLPKNEETVIEELRTHNDDLQKHVKMLLKELDTVKKENVDLNLKLKQKETLKQVLAEPLFTADNFGPFDLPPLEMPTLNLDILKEGLQSDDTFSEGDAQ